MNLHGIVAPYVGAVNPLLPVGVRISTGSSEPDAAGNRTPTFATPGALTGSISGTTLTVTAVASGTVAVGQTVVGSGVLPGTVITELDGGSGGPGTYEVNQEQEVSATAMTTSTTLLAQVQPMTFRDIQQIEGLNLQGTRKAIYLNGAVDGLIRESNKGGDIITMPDGTVWLVALVLEGFNPTAGWTKCAATLQNGS
jgi:hypothetical protein